jgi:starch phosphorylase
MFEQFKEKLSEISREKFGKSIKALDKDEVYTLIGEFVKEKCDCHIKEPNGKRVAYFSIEYLIGRLLWANLYNMNNTDYVEKALLDSGHSFDELDDVDDYAFGNGGLGRLAACFLDSAASCELPLDGYGIRYKYGLFRQSFSDKGDQIESADHWQKYTDAFARKRENESVTVEFSDFSVKAIPYDYDIIGYKFKRINTLRLFECKGINCNEKEAEKIYEYLYPDDSNYEGKKLRLRQQYFLVSASLQSIVNKYGLDDLENKIKIQLNDTHPVLAIPELINICIKNQMSFDDALAKARKIFAYTNHTVMPEALEVWDAEMLRDIIPQVYGIIEKINDMLKLQLSNNTDLSRSDYDIIVDGKVKMANLACYVCSHINGVANIHTEILKKDTLSQWYELYPEKFNNKTNGISQRRWLGLCNKQLTDFLSELCGCDIIEETENIKRLEAFRDDTEVLSALGDIKLSNKKKLCDYIKSKTNIDVDPDSVFVVQVKRIHEYKRQLMAAFAVVYLYFKIKKGELTELPGVTFIFGGKAAPGYKTAKSIIKYINNVSRVVNNDPDTNSKLKVVFLPDYNVSLAEKIIPAADVSLQISLAGTEASGTGNMKFMMNGAVTLGTYDGANIEICREAGEENNYIFGLREDEVNELRNKYDPNKIYKDNPMIKDIVDSLVSGKFGERYGFKDIYDTLLNDSVPDRYMVLADLMSFIEELEKCLTQTTDKLSFSRKCLMNIANSAYFSADRTIREYAEDIWFKE